VYGFAWMIVPIIFLAVWVALMALDHFVLGGQGDLAHMWSQSFAPFLIMSYVALAFFFIGLTWLFLSSAQKYIADRERMRIWRKEDEPESHTVVRVKPGTVKVG
jgi:hypothetical protein